MTPEQLKASILQRAMEGKLVPQDPNDEPASELLKRIKAEKEKLIKEGKIKRDKNETEIFRGDDGLHYEKFQNGSVKQTDVPYDIPESWEWVKIKSIYWNRKQGKPEKDFYYIDTTAIDNSNQSLSENIDKISFEQAPSRARKNIEVGDILFGTVRPYLKNIAIFDKKNDYYVASTAFIVMTPILVKNNFLVYALLSPKIQTVINQKSSGSNYPAINDTNFQELFIPIPPLQEQVRINKKLSELLKRIDQYAYGYSLLDILDKTFPEKLRKSILQYAMQGKLVPQDATDEPVEVLLEKIREEKQRLFKEGKLKKKDLQESIVYQGDDNSYYEKKSKELLQLEKIPSIPLTWKYLRFHQIANYYMGKTPPRSISTFWGNDIPWVSIADMVSDGVIYSTKEALSNTFKANIQEKISPPNTLLMSFKLTVGKVSLLGIEAAHNEAIISIFPYVDTNEIMKMYLFKFLPEIVKYGDSKDAIKGKTLNSKSINALLIPLPPLEEQKRIVDRIEKLDLSVAKLNFIQNKN